MSYSVEHYAYGLPWDGHTVTMDPQTHEVTGKLTNVALAMQPLDAKIVDYIRGKGLFLMANTQFMTRVVRPSRPATPAATEPRSRKSVTTGFPHLGDGPCQGDIGDPDRRGLGSERSSLTRATIGPARFLVVGH